MADFEFAPIFVEDENSVRERLFRDVQEGFAQVSTRVLDLREGSPLWLMLAGPAKELARAYQSMNDIAELAFVPFLQDDFLTDKAMEYGLVRLTERPAECHVSCGLLRRPVDWPGPEKPESRSPEAHSLRTS